MAEEVGRSERRVPDGSRVAVDETVDCGSVEMIVVIVGENDYVDRRQSIEFNARGNPPSGSDELQR
jgi:hypothetical protein